MSRSRRVPKFLRSQERIFWDMIRAGHENSISAVAAGMNRDWGEIRFRQAGGMPPALVDTPNRRFLTIEEREQILAGVSREDPIREIARRIGRAPSTILRELRRNKGKYPRYRSSSGMGRPTTRKSFYSPSRAQARADHRLSRPKPGKLTLNPKLA